MPATWSSWLRTLIVCLLISPIFLAVGWTIHRTAWRGRDYWQRRIGEQFAMRVELQDVHNPTPRQWTLRNGKFHASSDSAYLGTIHQMDWNEHDVPPSIRLTGVNLNGNQVARMFELLHDRVVQQPWLMEHPWAVSLADLRFQGPHDSCLYRQVDIQSAFQAGEWTVDAIATPSSTDGRPLHISVQRQVTGDEVTSHIDIQAKDCPLPAMLFKCGRQLDSSFLPQTSFTGSIWIDRNHQASRFEMVGTFAPLHLEPIVRATSLAEATGIIRIDLIQSQCLQGEWQALDVVVHFEPGTISGTALDRLATGLGLQVAANVTRTRDWQRESWPFDEGWMRIQASRDRLTVQACPVRDGQNTASNAILWHKGKPLVELHDPPQPGNSQILWSLLEHSKLLK